MKAGARMFSLVAIGLIVGCTSQPPVLNMDASGRTYDGLYSVDNVSVDHVWARPDIDLSGYDKVLLQGAGIQYRPVKVSGGSNLRSGGAAVFPLTDAQKARLSEEFARAFKEELSKLERLELTDETGPTVLVLRAGLLDVVSRVPPEPLGRSEIFLESVGEATLLVELVDAQSGTVLLRAIDRRAAKRQGSPMRSNPVRSWQEVRIMAQSWARRLREGLDALHRRMTID